MTEHDLIHEGWALWDKWPCEWVSMICDGNDWHETGREPGFYPA